MPSVHVIILNYRRPGNIGLIVETCLSVDAVERIHVIDQSDTDQHRLKSIPNSPRIVAARAPNIGAGRRLSYASELPCDLVLAIDDDVFLTSPQTSELIVRSHQDPARVHGVWGQLILDFETGPLLQSGVVGVNLPVDILNRVYAFSPEHARNALRIAGSLGLQPDNLGPVDDILLSFGAPGRPMCHDLGILRVCKTSDQPDIAVWKQAGFERIRIAVVEKLRRMGRARVGT